MFTKQLGQKTEELAQLKHSLAQTKNPELAELQNKYDKIKAKHDTEVKTLFENIGTLKFVKELRFFKNQW